MKKIKYNDKKKIHENVDLICKHFNLSDEIRECISSIAKKSYIIGSNDCYKTFFNNEKI